MSYAKQSTTVDRLMKETLSSFDTHIENASAMLEKHWEETKGHLKSAIMMEYHKSFSAGTWTLSAAKNKGVMLRIEKITRIFLQNFMATIENDFKKKKKAMYAESLKRYAWVTDQVTPATTRVSMPNNFRAREAVVDVYTGSAAAASWTERMGAWLGAYHSSLQNNIALGALAGSSIHDAAEEVDKTKAGTPSYDVFDALNRILEVELWAEAMSAEDDFYGENYKNLGFVEIWKTRYGIDVCDDCSENEGLTAEEADGDIPLHPNCRCFWRIVPASFRDLLLQGDDDSRGLAYDMDARGLVPDSLVMRDTNGDIVGKTIVSFREWSNGEGQSVGAFR